MTAAEASSLPLSRPVVQAVQIAAARYVGVTLDDDAAEAIARAAIEQADTVCHVRQVIDGEMWEREDVRESVRQHQRRQIFCELADKGMVPVAWPAERVRRERWAGGEDVLVTVERSVPARVAVG